MTQSKDWTFGAEHEFADWDIRLPLTKHTAIDVDHTTLVNSNGIANSGDGSLYSFGGEVTTSPTDTIDGQCGILSEFLELHPVANVNYRSAVQLHIRVPGLREDAAALKRLIKFGAQWLPMVHDRLGPTIKRPESFATIRERQSFTNYRQRLNGRRRVLKDLQIKQMLLADTYEKIGDAECINYSDDGKPLWFLSKRSAVNLRQLKVTDTIEFRHHAGTTDPEQLRCAFSWWKTYLECALFDPGVDLEKVWDEHDHNFPVQRDYSHWHEERFFATRLGGIYPRSEVIKNIAAVEAGTFVPTDYSFKEKHPKMKREDRLRQKAWRREAFADKTPIEVFQHLPFTTG